MNDIVNTPTDADIAFEGSGETDSFTDEQAFQDAIPDAASSEGEERGSADLEQPFLTTLFNHETRRFDRREAEELVQLGLYSKPHLDRLRYLAGLSGEKSVKEMLNTLVLAKEQEIFAEVSDKISDPELAKQVAEERINKFKGEWDEGNETHSVHKQRDDLNRRLANEFVELQGDFSGIERFSDLPYEVKRTSAEESVPLKYAYALYACREQAKIKAAESAENDAAKAASQSFKSTVSDGTSPEMAQVYKALWGE